MEDSLQEKVRDFFRAQWLPIALGVFGLMFLGYGLIVLSSNNQKKEEMVFESADTLDSDSSQKQGVSAKAKQIFVDVEGAVQKPGVYELQEEARVQDALIAAGGMHDQADRGKVAQGLNLAAPLADGAKLYIPFEGETAPVSGGSGGETVLGSATGLVNINAASSSELDSLKGVGPVTAEKIISNRPYTSVDELLSKKVVGQKVFEGIKEQVTIY